jgi:hypothetical protein
VASSTAWPTRIGQMRGEDRLSVGREGVQRGPPSCGRLCGTSYPGRCCSEPPKPCTDPRGRTRYRIPLQRLGERNDVSEWCLTIWPVRVPLSVDGYAVHTERAPTERQFL